MLSGIGPSNDLRRAGIPVIFNNPNVGKHLTNHTLNTATFSVNPKDLPQLQNDPFALYTGGAFLPNPLIAVTILTEEFNSLVLFQKEI